MLYNMVIVIEKKTLFTHSVTSIGKYNDNTGIDVNFFQYFTSAAGSSEMHLKKIDGSVVFYR